MPGRKPAQKEAGQTKKPPKNAKWSLADDQLLMEVLHDQDIQQHQPTALYGHIPIRNAERAAVPGRFHEGL